MVLHSAYYCVAFIARSAELLPPLGPWSDATAGIRFQEIDLPSNQWLWAYIPDDRTSEGLPCVVIAPAGSRLFHGLELMAGDKPEHLPYVAAGFAVVAYSIAGRRKEPVTPDEMLVVAREFLAADGGIGNARIAIDFALGRMKVDPTRLFVAGHSSAATLALQVAMAEPRVKAAVAYAPVTHLRKYLGEEAIEFLDTGAPGYRAWVEAHDPIVATSSLTCPTLVFHAKDDSVVAFADSQRFVEIARRTNQTVSFVSAETGDHYDSMIDDGIVAGIQFLTDIFPR